MVTPSFFGSSDSRRRLYRSEHCACRNWRIINVAEACQFGSRALAGESSVLSLAERRIWTACTHDMKPCVQGQKVETISLLPEYEAFSRMYCIELHGSARRTWGSAKAMEITFGRTGPSLVQKVSSPREQGRNGREEEPMGVLLKTRLHELRPGSASFQEHCSRRDGWEIAIWCWLPLDCLLYPCEVSVVQHGM